MTRTSWWGIGEAGQRFYGNRVRGPVPHRWGANPGVWCIEHDIGAKGTKAPADARLARLATRQHGVVSRRQLETLGLGRGAIANRVRSGRLHVVHRGVFAVGLPTLSRDGAFMAAVLAGGEGAVLSHRSAAELWGLLAGQGRLIDITVRGQAGRRDRRIRVHRNALAADEVATMDGIPVTSVGRTLVDIAAERRVEAARERLLAGIPRDFEELSADAGA